MTKQEKINFYTGKSFNDLTILNFENSKLCGKSKVCIVKCICKCGKIYIGPLKKLKSGEIKSCGCKIGKTHGLSKENGKETAEYRTWRRIKNRCYNKNCPNYKEYGKRGIKVCEEWKNSFETFLKDMGKRPKGNYSIERINVNDNYCKENCKWIPMSDQGKNTRRNIIIEYSGQTKCLSEWSKQLGFVYNTVKKRIKKGIPFEEAIKIQ